MPQGPVLGTWVLGLLFISRYDVHAQQFRFCLLIRPPTTVRLLLRVLHQSALYRIGMHIVQLFQSLSVAVNVEIVEPRLPECWQWLARTVLGYFRSSLRDLGGEPAAYGAPGGGVVADYAEGGGDGDG